MNTSTGYGRAVFQGITRYANLQRPWVLFVDVDHVLADQTQWPVLDGAIVAGFPAHVVAQAQTMCRHVIYCSGAGDPRQCPVVGLDDLLVGKVAAEHLLDRGLENLAFFGLAPGYVVAERRAAGFLQTVEDRGINFIRCPIPEVTSKERVSHSHRPALIDWLVKQPKPLGVLTLDDMHGLELAGACQEAGLSVPDQVAIIGVNNDELLCESAWPPLTSVDGGFNRVGFKAAEILDLLLGGRELSTTQRLVLLPPVGVVERQSTNVLSVKDPNLIRAVRFIGEHACDPCDVADILRAVPVNRRWLERSFRRHFGRTLHEEMARVRIDTAKRFLHGSDYNIGDIAARCGFAEPKRFFVTFRRVTGTTPAAYRRSSTTT